MSIFLLHHTKSYQDDKRRISLTRFKPAPIGSAVGGDQNDRGSFTDRSVAKQISLLTETLTSERQGGHGDLQSQPECQGCLTG